MDVEHSARSRPNHLWRWSTYLPLFFLAIWVLLYWPTFVSLYSRWIKWDQSLSHGLAVMAVFVYLAVKSLPWNVSPFPRPWFVLVLAGLAFSSLLWLISDVIHISSFAQLLLLPILALAIAGAFGIRTALAHRFLLLLPIFAIPIWGSLNGVLLDMSSFVVGELVRLAGMPALIEGNSIFIPHGHILIADGCSGLRYFVVALFLGYLIAYLNNYRETGFVAVLAVAGLIGLVANWIRIFVLIVVGYQTEMKSSLMSDHEMFGWILFALLCAPAMYFAPVRKRQQNLSPNEPEAESKPTSMKRLVAVCAVLALGPLIGLGADLDPKTTPLGPQMSEGAGKGAAQTLPVAFTGPDSDYSEVVRLSSEVFLRIDQYQRSNKEEKLVPYFRRLYRSEDWVREDQGSVMVSGEYANLSIFREKASSNSVAQLQWFEVGGYRTTSKATAKLLQIPAIFSGKDHFTIITMQARCSGEKCGLVIEMLNQQAASLSERRVEPF